MPLVYTESVWQSLYHSLWKGETVTYSRDFAKAFGGGAISGWINRRLDPLEEVTGVNAGRTLVVGCGFGFLMECMVDRGWTDVWGIDASEWIGNNIAAEAREDVASRILTGFTVGVNSTDEIQEALAKLGCNGTFDLVIDDDAASSHSDSELASFYSGMEELGSGDIVHLVSALHGARGDTAINWKTAESWAATAPDHFWIDIVDSKVVS